MKIKQATAEELGLLIMGLEAIFVAEQEATHKKLLEQLRAELSTRHGLTMAKAGLYAND